MDSGLRAGELVSLTGPKSEKVAGRSCPVLIVGVEGIDFFFFFFFSNRVSLDEAVLRSACLCPLSAGVKGVH